MIMDTLMLSPGLYHLVETILIEHIDLASLAQVEKVCRLWRHFVAQRRIWHKRLTTQLAPPDTHARHLIDTNDDTNDDTSDEEAHVMRVSKEQRRLCWRLDVGLFEWRWKSFSVRTFSNANNVRALKVLDNELVFTNGNTLCIADRRMNSHHIRPSSGPGHSCCTTSEVMREEHVLRGQHRRDVACFDVEDDLVVTGGRDRILCFWNKASLQCFHKENQAHARLITELKIRGSTVVSASRDRLLKVWKVWSASSVVLWQQLSLHSYSVWTCDLSASFLISGSSDKSLGVWRLDTHTKQWLEHTRFTDASVSNGFRQVLLLRCHSKLAISGDTFGGLKMWNLDAKCLHYELPEQDDANWFRHSGAVYAIEEVCHPTLNHGFIAVAFGNNRIVLYFTKNVFEALSVDRVIHLDSILGHGMLRNIAVSDTQIVVSHLADKAGIAVLDIW